MKVKRLLLGILDILWRGLAVLLLVCLIAVCATGVSPVYPFRPSLEKG